MQKKYNQVLALTTSVLLLFLNCILSFTVFAEEAENVFTAAYEENTDTIVVTLSAGGNVALNSFKGAFTYDKSKYTLESAESKESNTLVNSLPDKGRVVVSLGSAANISKETVFCSIVLKKPDKADSSDFKFEFIDEPENAEGEIVKYSLNTFWNDEKTGEVTQSIVTTKAKPETTVLKTTPVTTLSAKPQTTVSPVNKNDNIFYYYYKENKESNCIDLLFGVKGNVEFAAVDGSFTIVSEGLADPEIQEQAPGMFAFYSKDRNELNYVFTSSSGKNIVTGMTLLKCSFNILDEGYSIDVIPSISSVGSEKDDVYNYSLVNEDEAFIPPVTTVTSPVTTKPSVTTTVTKPVTTKPSVTTTVTKPVTTKPSVTTTVTKPVTTKPSVTTTVTKPVTTTVQVTTNSVTVTTVPVTESPELSVSEKEIIIRNGEQYKIEVNQSDLTYRSNNTDVAIVSKNGVITAIGEGDAIITIINSDSDVVQIKVFVSSPLVFGDCNNDKRFDALDVLALKNYLLDSAVSANLENADFNGDKVIDIFDLIRMKNKLLKL